MRRVLGKRPPHVVSASFFMTFFLACAATLRSDEWKARHALVAPNGTMTLTIPPSPSEVFFS